MHHSSLQWLLRSWSSLPNVQRSTMTDELPILSLQWDLSNDPQWLMNFQFCLLQWGCVSLLKRIFIPLYKAEHVCPKTFCVDKAALVIPNLTAIPLNQPVPVLSYRISWSVFCLAVLTYSKPQPYVYWSGRSCHSKIDRHSIINGVVLNYHPFDDTSIRRL